MFLFCSFFFFFPYIPYGDLSTLGASGMGLAAGGEKCGVFPMGTGGLWEGVGVVVKCPVK